MCALGGASLRCSAFSRGAGRFLFVEIDSTDPGRPSSTQSTISVTVVEESTEMNISSLPKFEPDQFPEELSGYDAESESFDQSLNITQKLNSFNGFELDQSTDSNGMRPSRSVHQCAVCNKIFVSLKGLQQHAIIHTDQKPFSCDICNKSFRFKSNLFEHRSVHSGFTPHSCPFCGKTCRLKGNLKKHLKTHVSTKEELDQAWRPFASNRRPPADIPSDAIIVRSGNDALFTPPSRARKRKLGLGNEARVWVEKIKRGEILPQASLNEKMRRLSVLIEAVNKQSYSREDFFRQAKAMAFEKFECPLCKSVFMSRLECKEHLEMEHPHYLQERPFFCDMCIKCFVDQKTLEQHQSYHARIRDLIENKQLTMTVPEMLLPQACEDEQDGQNPPEL
ncbi:unnamed protein product [Bursaphelenchus xylophilus]|uniref:(pine wood nematode) hypothetical protein n=1 Tax=Bursaphelenchus xylophilus TaxID=6326 RepID=A0A7I8XCW8_BURXY|nr:unnamed protein product [Bursaphelenchus xylophilus]CAG9131648.1 unnamed protein product [Bursaphelenchus xylophilus]